MWTGQEILDTIGGFDRIVKYDAKYKGYTVYQPYSSRKLTLGYPRFYLVKGDELRDTNYPYEFEKVVAFLKANDVYPKIPHIPD